MIKLLSTLGFAAALLAQVSGTGELRLEIADSAGLPVSAGVVVSSQASQVHRSLTAAPDGRLMVKDLPLGQYRVEVRRDGFAPYSALVEIHSAVPVELKVALAIAPVASSVIVTDADTLLDPRRTGSVYHVGSEAIDERHASQPGRSVVDLVNAQPGWLLEANGVLHPRGSEYDVQYVVDGIPVTDNRSPAFAPEFDADDIQSMNVLTANYPAEFGRKLGGVIEVTTARDGRVGFHGKAIGGGGSFDTASGFWSGQYTSAHGSIGASVEGARTSRYLDAPVEENFTNRATNFGVTAQADRDFSDADRVRLRFQRSIVRFQVPNERLQETAGQRQDRDSVESSGQASWQHVVSPSVIVDARGMVRDLSANLWSNALSTPVIAGQQREYRDGYVKGSISAHSGAHDWKAGVEADFATVQETFSYRITDSGRFDVETPAVFRFAGRQPDREQAVFIQDVARLGNWTLSAGLRWDHYRLLTSDNAFSPRLGAAWYWPRAGLILRASYDRVFQTPAFENLLLASSPQAEVLNSRVLRLAVPPSLGSFYQAGFAKAFFGHLRLDGNWYRRTFRNFPDDDLFLNTGVSFPIAFARAEIRGFEARIEVPRWGRFSGFVSWSNIVGTGYLPVTGGLFLGDKTADLSGAGRFPITQDQRNTVQSRIRVQASPRAWIAMSSAYGSGLPVEIDPASDPELAAQYGSRILDRVNFSRGRVRPSFTIDATAGIDLWRHEKQSVTLQADVRNLTDRLNVINFAGLFSGTAIGPPRSFGVRLRAEF
ncbi:MAG: TonB-dependent receptor [Acidobacteriota bacterium]|nr:TonB-dependent receptor [Acidobacteriota bacterium]